MKKIRVLIAGVLAGSFLLGASPALAQPVYFGATSKEESCQALSDIDPGSGSCTDPEGPTVQRLMRVAINLISIVAGVIAVIMLIVSGFKYVTSQGDATEISNSKKTLIYAIVGLVLVAFAQIIVRYVLARAT